jgi:hypothetical protein
MFGNFIAISAAGSQTGGYRGSNTAFASIGWLREINFLRLTLKRAVNRRALRVAAPPIGFIMTSSGLNAATGR